MKFNFLLVSFQLHKNKYNNLPEGNYSTRLKIKTQAVKQLNRNAKKLCIIFNSHSQENQEISQNKSKSYYLRTALINNY